MTKCDALLNNSAGFNWPLIESVVRCPLSVMRSFQATNQMLVKIKEINVTRVCFVYMNVCCSMWDVTRVRVPSLLCVARKFLVNVHVWFKCHKFKCYKPVFRPV